MPVRLPRIPRRAFRLICAPPETVPVCLLTEAGWGGVNCLYLPVYGRHSVKRFLICGLLSVLFLSGLCAGPFGLSMGMNLDEIRDACGGVRPQKAAEVSGLDFDDDMYVIFPEKTHSAFEVYFAWVDEDAGLYAIRAASSEIPDDGYGENVKTRFYSVAESISKTYGKPEIADAYRGERGFFDGDSMWMMALTRGCRRNCTCYARRLFWKQYIRLCRSAAFRLYLRQRGSGCGTGRERLLGAVQKRPRHKQA